MRHYTLTAEDVEKPFLRAFGQAWPMSGFIGRVLAGDVGKRVYLRGGILQVENDEQRAARVDHPCQSLHNHSPEEYTAKPGTTRCQRASGGCYLSATLHLFRVAAYVHETPIHDTLPIDFCEPCGDKALESGLYCVGDDLLEPHHGPGCINRMHADILDGEEGGQS